MGFFLQVSTSEESVTVTLHVIRTQGVVGDVKVEYRTLDGSAQATGKTPPDYQVGSIQS